MYIYYILITKREKANFIDDLKCFSKALKHNATKQLQAEPTQTNVSTHCVAELYIIDVFMSEYACNSTEKHDALMFDVKFRVKKYLRKKIQKIHFLYKGNTVPIAGSGKTWPRD